MAPQRMAGGFTLVELMIVVGIVGILAAIAVPNFYSMQMKSKFAEVPLVHDGIIAAATAYEIEGNPIDSIDTLQVPSGTPGKSPRPWDTGTDYDVMGFAPDGDVRCTYRLACIPNECDTSIVCDMDGNGSFVRLGSTYYAETGQTAIVGANEDSIGGCATPPQLHSCMQRGLY